MRCICKTKTPKGVVYHPALKSVYERKGAFTKQSKGQWVKVGYRCPKCKKFYAIEG